MNEIAKLITNAATRCIRFLSRHPYASMATVVLLLTVLVLHNQLKLLTERRITVLVGPKSGNAERRIRSIEKYLASHSGATYWSRHYVLQPELTDGYEENRARVNDDASGTVIGFAHDGFAPPDNVRTVLPLTESFLHVIVNKDFYEGTVEPTKDSVAKARVFEAIISKLQDPASNGRVYLGPENSGTRQLAVVVLKHYGLNPENLEMSGTRSWDWSDMARELLRSRVAVGFCATPIETNNFISSIAQSGKCVLVGFENVDGLRTGRPYLLRRSFPAHAYSGSKDFCTAEQNTIATKNLLICSSAMSELDAYLLASIVREALRDEIPQVEWKRTAAARVEPEELTFFLHPGADLLRAGQTPGWFNTLRSVWLIVLVPFIMTALSELAKRVNDRWGTHRLASPSPAPLLEPAPARDIAATERHIDDLGHLAAAPETSPLQIVAVLQQSASHIRSRVLADQVRMSYLDIVARFIHDFPDARIVISDVAADEGESLELRLEAIRHLRESGRFDPDVETTLMDIAKSRVKTVAHAARNALREIRTKQSKSIGHTSN